MIRPASARPSCSVRILDGAQWLRLAGQFRDHGYTQTWGFAHALARRDRACCEHVALERDGAVVGLAAVRIREVPLLPSGLAYVSGGPRVRRGARDDAAALADAVALLRDEYVARRGHVLLLRPPVGFPGHTAEVDQHLAAFGFEPAPGLARHQTILLDLTRGEPALRAGLTRAWRKNLHRACREDFEVHRSTDPGDLDRLCTPFDDLIRRKHFTVDLDTRFHARLQREHQPAERFEVWLATERGELLGGLVTSCLGDTVVNLIAANTLRARARRVSYRLHWEIGVDACTRGFSRYDLGGIDPEANPGVTAFKRGMGGDDVWAPGPYICRPRSIGGRLLPAGAWLYRKSRDLAAHLRPGGRTTSPPRASAPC